jgi:UDP-GlcNAc:undecaprenyl-phosphate/decaprenyl-phosphate GlcNAc-1-phosphate transferase
MSKFIPIILASGLISFIATPLLRKLAASIDFVDNPERRKLHVTPMPMLGGLAIYFGLVSATVMTNTRMHTEMMGIISGATVVTLFGLWDDRYGMRPLVKLGGQALATLILITAGIQVTLFQASVLNVALTFLWVLGISNALNLLDNMDGLAAGITAVISGFFLVLAVVEGLGVVSTLAAAMLGACVGFLYYNFNPATLFMGDAGSLLVGYILAVLGIKLTFAGRPQDVTWMIPIILLGLPIFDTTLVILSRLRHGRPVYQGGKDHTSHRLVSVFGMTPARAVMTLYLVSSVLGLLALMLRDSTPGQARLILVVLSVLFVAALFWMEYKFSYTPPDADITPPH